MSPTSRPRWRALTATARTHRHTFWARARVRRTAVAMSQLRPRSIFDGQPAGSSGRWSAAAAGPRPLRSAIRPGWLTARRLCWSGVSNEHGPAGSLSALAAERGEALAELLGPGHL